MNQEPPDPPLIPTLVGVWEFYQCGCVSDTVAPKLQKTLSAKCKDHQKPRVKLMPEIGYSYKLTP